jgi:hypothetical protein
LGKSIDGRRWEVGREKKKNEKKRQPEDGEI